MKNIAVFAAIAVTACGQQAKRSTLAANKAVKPVPPPEVRIPDSGPPDYGPDWCWEEREGIEKLPGARASYRQSYALILLGRRIVANLDGRESDMLQFVRGRLQNGARVYVVLPTTATIKPFSASIKVTTDRYEAVAYAFDSRRDDVFLVEVEPKAFVDGPGGTGVRFFYRDKLIVGKPPYASRYGVIALGCVVLGPELDIAVYFRNLIES